MGVIKVDVIGEQHKGGVATGGEHVAARIQKLATKEANYENRKDLQRQRSWELRC